MGSMSTDSAATEVLGTEPHEGEGLKVHIIRAMSSTTSSISAPMEEEKRTEELRVLLCLSGSVAAMKAVELVEAFRASACVKLALSNAAMHFIDLQTLNASGVSVFSDRHEWQAYKERGDPVLHIELRKWADVIVFAPLSANTLGKISNGIADNLITSIARAWNFSKKFFVAPAMNTAMWKHPITEVQLSLLKSWGVEVIDPIEKTLICGDTGVGAMAEPRDVARIVLNVALNTSA